MHLIIGLVVAVMALFPGSAGEGGLNLRAWMEAYETRLYEQMEANFEREKAETVTSEPKNAVSQQNMEVNDEQTASEETQDVLADGRLSEEFVEVLPQSVPEETAASRPEVVVPEPQEVTPLYQVDGYIPDQGLQTYLYQRLCDHGIGYFMPYAVCLIAQESTWNPMAENRNGRDKGLLQFRVEYVPWMDWRNPYQQIDYFVAQMANRAKNGKTVSEMISAHNQSDYGPYCQEYVSIVMSHEAGLVRIR